VEYILQYDSPEETRDAFHNLVKSYGEDAVMVNLPVETKAASWSQTTSNRTSARSVSWGSDVMLLDALRDRASSAGGPTGKVIVGVLDSGVNPTHELLKGRISPASAAIKKYIAAGSTPYLDENGHGTHVAGIIADATPPQVEILAVRTTDSNGGGDFNSLLVGMQYAASHGARVINVSFGGDLYTNSGISVARYQAILDNYEKAIHNICSNYDCMVVVAAGNSGLDIETSKAFPACFPEVITVGKARFRVAMMASFGSILSRSSR
jgi:subtilisin family serine protease